MSDKKNYTTKKAQKIETNNVRSKVGWTIPFILACLNTLPLKDDYNPILNTIWIYLFEGKQ